MPAESVAQKMRNVLRVPASAALAMNISSVERVTSVVLVQAVWSLRRIPLTAVVVVLSVELANSVRMVSVYVEMSEAPMVRSAVPMNPVVVTQPVAILRTILFVPVDLWRVLQVRDVVWLMVKRLVFLLATIL